MRCPYCGTQNDEAAEVCRKCTHELPHERGPWRGPTATFGSPAASNVQSAHDEWDPARRHSQPQAMSKFVAPARYPEHLGWAITILVLGLPATVIHAILFWNQVQYPRHLGWGVGLLLLCCVPLGMVAVFLSRAVRRKHAVGDDGRAYRYSRLTMLFCWIALIAGLALYVIIFLRLLEGAGALSGY